ncbi:MAG: helix-turn-helix transcriptional regulator [Rhodoglobus sp.]
MDHPIAALRTKQHLSRTELAQRASVRRGTIERAESGMGVSVRSALRIARALDVTVEQLFAGCA